ncbi:hypothetical protein ACHQM5_028746 [Ranunculus cassubicifolius]
MPLMNKDALVRALDAGRLAQAAVDVFTKEPPSPDSKLIQHENATEGVAIEIAEAVVGALKGKLSAKAVYAPMVSLEVLSEPVPYMILAKRRDSIHESTILQKNLFNATSSSRPATLKNLLNDFAMQQHKMSFLNNESVHIDQWEIHSQRGYQCRRMKMGRILTGVGDQLVKVWSLESYKCIEQYSAPNMLTLEDIDFDESKVVGLLGSRICIWRRDEERTMFPYDTSASGLCMRYIDPEVVVGCMDGAARVYNMDSECSHTIRMHTGPILCLSLTDKISTDDKNLADKKLILSGSTCGSIKSADLSSGKLISLLKFTKSTDLIIIATDITTLCYNSSSFRVFVGLNSGHLHCWDLRKNRQLWKKRVSRSKICSLQHMQKDTSSVVAGGMDGVVRIVNQDTGEILSSYVIDDDSTSSADNTDRVIEREGRMISNDFVTAESVPKTRRPDITCLAVGMQKVITTHNNKIISVGRWRRISWEGRPKGRPAMF